MRSTHVADWIVFSSERDAKLYLAIVEPELRTGHYGHADKLLQANVGYTDDPDSVGVSGFSLGGIDIAALERDVIGKHETAFRVFLIETLPRISWKTLLKCDSLVTVETLLAQGDREILSEGIDEDELWEAAVFADSDHLTEREEVARAVAPVFFALRKSRGFFPNPPKAVEVL